MNVSSRFCSRILVEGCWSNPFRSRLGCLSGDLSGAIPHEMKISEASGPGWSGVLGGVAEVSARVFFALFIGSVAICCGQFLMSRRVTYEIGMTVLGFGMGAGASALCFQNYVKQVRSWAEQVIERCVCDLVDRRARSMCSTLERFLRKDQDSSSLPVQQVFGVLQVYHKCTKERNSNSSLTSVLRTRIRQEDQLWIGAAQSVLVEYGLYIPGSNPVEEHRLSWLVNQVLSVQDQKDLVCVLDQIFNLEELVQETRRFLLDKGVKGPLEEPTFPPPQIPEAVRGCFSEELNPFWPPGPALDLLLTR